MSRGRDYVGDLPVEIAERLMVRRRREKARRTLVTKRYRQRLGDITPEEINKEGYETIEEFQRAWGDINGAWDPGEVLWVYEFKVLNSSEDKIERR